MFLHLNSKKSNFITIDEPIKSINKITRSVSMDDVNILIPGIIFDYKDEKEKTNFDTIQYQKIQNTEINKNEIQEIKVDIDKIEEIQKEFKLKKEYKINEYNLVQSDIICNNINSNEIVSNKGKIKVIQKLIEFIFYILLIIGTELKFERWNYIFIVGLILDKLIFLLKNN
jgi:hypothetical protein